MKKVSAIVYHEYGNPVETVRVEERELAEPQDGEVLVEVKAAPINPADLNTIEGKYPVRPALPAVPGIEGVGVVAAVGPGVSQLKTGSVVLLPHGLGTWREAAVVPEKDLVELPADVPLEQAAMLKINPPTAWRMLHDFVTLKPGDWMIQNAANSGVGRATIQIAGALGLRTVNIVRRPELIDELKTEGGDVVLLEGDDLKERVKEATGGAKILLAFNSVGGESALNLANTLANGGTLVTFGAMSKQPLRIPNGLLIFKDLRWRGFWLTRWYQNASREERDAMFASLVPLLQSGKLKTKIEKTYPLSQAKEAIARALEGKRDGKILFGMG
jgi:trans-2-enoyl-CoA reductase